jgi:hypothetical protein
MPLHHDLMYQQARLHDTYEETRRNLVRMSQIVSENFYIVSVEPLDRLIQSLDVIHTSLSNQISDYVNESN